MHLFINTETDGTSGNWNVPSSVTNNWPRMVEIAWSLADDAGMAGYTPFML